MALALNVFQTIPYVAPTGGAVGIKGSKSREKKKTRRQ